MIRCYLTIVVIISTLIIACEPLDSGIRDRSQYYYINSSDYQVAISVFSPEPLGYVVLDSIIPIGDTVRFNNLEPEGRTGTPFGTNVIVKVIFNADTLKCLVFEGQIAQDSNSNDIRYSASYMQALMAVDGGLVKYYYTITNSHYQKATQCD